MHGSSPLTVGRLLETDGLGRPRLVVLSACETGLYDIDRSPDEFIGLPGAFTTLGAAGVLATLWWVSDDATALLIAKFYELHLSGRLSPSAALRQAQRWLRSATNVELRAYAEAGAKEGRLAASDLASIQQSMTHEALLRSRSRHQVAWAPKGGGERSNNLERPTASAGEPNASSSIARPYAHPYFWAGFVHTGL